jgi:GTPase Era involved in 16S rRNA processing
MLTSRMQRRVEQELADCDAVLFVVDGVQGVGGPGDRFIAEALSGTGTPVTIAVNKADRLDNPHIVRALQGAAELDAEFGLDAEIFPISAARGTGVQPLLDHLVARLPEGPFFFPEDEVSDLREEVWLAEMVREQVLRRTRQEVPHAVEVQVEEIDDGPKLVTVRAAMPIALIILPWCPIRMPFWDSVSTHMIARTSTSFSRSSISSTCTSTACGTSWRVRRSTCSRTSSASITRSGWSE